MAPARVTPEEALLAHVRARWPGHAEGWAPGSGNARWGAPPYAVLTVIEPCESCGEPVVLLHPEGAPTPTWFQLGGLARLTDDEVRLRFEGHGQQRCRFRRFARDLYGQ